MTTFAITTTAVAEANVPPCDFCDADMVGTEIGDGIYAVQIAHSLGCPMGLPQYKKP